MWPEHGAGADVGPGMSLKCKIVSIKGSLGTSRLHQEKLITWPVPLDETKRPGCINCSPATLAADGPSLPGCAQFWQGQPRDGEVIARVLEKQRSSKQLLEGQANARAEPGVLQKQHGVTVLERDRKEKRGGERG